MGDGVIADFDDRQIEQLLVNVNVPMWRGGSYQPADYPPVDYIATDNAALVEAAFMHLKEKGLNRFAFYGLMASSDKRWAQEREYAFRQLGRRNNTKGWLIKAWLPPFGANWQ